MKNACGSLLVVVLAAGLAGCISNDRSLQVVHNSFRTEGCDGFASENSFRAEGLLDLAGGGRYVMVPLLKNFMYNSKAGVSMSVNLQQARISYEWLEGRELLEDPQWASVTSSLVLIEDQEVTVPMSGRVEAASGVDEPSKTWIDVEVVHSSDIGKSLAALTRTSVAFPLDRLYFGVHLTVEGETVGGTGISSNEFVYPIRFCSGCLATEIFDNVAQYVCCVHTTSTEDNTAPSCYPGQDDAPTCSCEEDTP
jgi:hypothetical protein